MKSERKPKFIKSKEYVCTVNIGDIVNVTIEVQNKDPELAKLYIEALFENLCVIDVRVIEVKPKIDDNTSLIELLQFDKAMLEISPIKSKNALKQLEYINKLLELKEDEQKCLTSSV